jgi:hypothetical protein
MRFDCAKGIDQAVGVVGEDADSKNEAVLFYEEHFESGR